VGKGAYGEVYKALNVETGEFVAIKKINTHRVNPQQLNTFMAEVHLLKADHLSK